MIPTKPTIALISIAIQENTVRYFNENGFDLITASNISEISMITPKVIMLRDENWEAQLEAIQHTELYENVPVLLIKDCSKVLSAEAIKDKGIFCFVQELQSSIALMLTHSAVQQFEKNTENTIKNNELNRLLSTNYLMLDAKNQFLEQAQIHLETFIKDDMKISRKALEKLNAKIEKHLKEEYQYQLFKVHFEEVHPLFYKKLLMINSNLSDTNLKLLSFIKMGFNNSEISFFMNISLSGVKKGIQRLKQKLKIPPDDSLRKFIFNI